MAVLSAVLTWLAPTASQAADARPAAGTEGWRVTVTPYVWATSFAGKLTTMGQSARFSEPFTDGLSDLDVAGMGVVEATNGVVGVLVDGLYVHASQRADGGAVKAGIAYGLLSGSVYWNGPELGSQDGVRLSIQPLAGLRWTHVAGKLSGFGVRTSDAADWVDPFIGVRLPVRLSQRWSAELEADIGGFGAGSSISANGSLRIAYSATVFGQSTRFSIGYRALYEEYHTGKGEGRFALDAVTHGPLLGISLSL